MDMQNNPQENHDFEKVAELLTPKHPRRCDFAFSIPTKKRITSKIWTISGVAAMFVVVLTIAIKSVLPVSATEVVHSAFTTLASAESIKVEFVWRGVKTSSEEIYSPDPSGNVISGTLYLLRKNGKVNMRIDWHDAEKNSIMFNSCDYIHLQDNHIANKYSTAFGAKLMELFSMKTLPDDLKNTSELSTEGNMIMIKNHKENITFYGVFQKDSKRLVKASAIVSLPEGTNITLLETKSIETGIDITESMFFE